MALNADFISLRDDENQSRSNNFWIKNKSEFLAVWICQFERLFWKFTLYYALAHSSSVHLSARRTCSDWKRIHFLFMIFDVHFKHHCSEAVTSIISQQKPAHPPEGGLEQQSSWRVLGRDPAVHYHRGLWSLKGTRWCCLKGTPWKRWPEHPPTQRIKRSAWACLDCIELRILLELNCSHMSNLLYFSQRSDPYFSGPHRGHAFEGKREDSEFLGNE